MLRSFTASRSASILTLLVVALTAACDGPTAPPSTEKENPLSDQPQDSTPDDLEGSLVVRPPGPASDQSLSGDLTNRIERFMTNPNEGAGELEQFISELPVESAREIVDSALARALRDPVDLVAYIRASHQNAGRTTIRQITPELSARNRENVLQASNVECPMTVIYVNGLNTRLVEWLMDVEVLFQFLRFVDVQDITLISFYNQSAVDEGSIFGQSLPCTPEPCFSETRARQAELCDNNLLGLLIDIFQAADQAIGELLRKYLLVRPTGASGLPDAFELATIIEQEVDQGNIVVLMAHSQGNYFASQALDFLSDEQLDSVGVIQVGSPPGVDTSQAGLSLSVGFCRDVIVAGGGLTLPPDNCIEPFKELEGLDLYPKGDCFICGSELSRTIHSFQCAYLADPNARMAIGNALEQMSRKLWNETCSCGIGSPCIEVTIFRCYPIWGQKPCRDGHDTCRCHESFAQEQIVTIRSCMQLLGSMCPSTIDVPECNSSDGITLNCDGTSDCIGLECHIQAGAVNRPLFQQAFLDNCPDSLLETPSIYYDSFEAYCDR